MREKGDLLGLFLKNFIQCCFICRPSDSTVSVDAVVATLAWTVRSSIASRPARVHAGGIDSLESISGLLKRYKYRPYASA